MYLELLNENSGAIQAISTIILVVITSIYAYLTHRYVILTKKLLKIEENRDEKKAQKEIRPMMNHPNI